MTTASTAFVGWRNARDGVREAIAQLNGALINVTLHHITIVEILRRHGPVTHDGHVYWLRGDEIVVEPVVSSSQVILEEEKQ